MSGLSEQLAELLTIGVAEHASTGKLRARDELVSLWLHGRMEPAT